MAQSQRKGHMDVSNTVDVTDADAVATAVHTILRRCYPGCDFYPVDRLFGDFSRLYGGRYPGFRACDLGYHDAQHVLDVTLAMARLIDGHERNPGTVGSLGPELALAGIAAALFHDSGYIRRTRDHRNKNGAAYTRVHVSRSARFLAEYLPGVGLQRLTGVCTRIVHFTGYELEPGDIPVACGRERRLGTLLGSADLIAQMADAEYVRKCRDHLYEEFEIGGLAGEWGHNSHTGIVYRSPAHLLETTPAFMQRTIDERLEGQLEGVHHCVARHFGGSNPYMDAIAENRRQLQLLLTGEPVEEPSPWPV